MIGVLQRVREAQVRVEGEIVSSIQEGILLLVGVARGDGPEDAGYVARKTAGLRIFPDSRGNLNRSVLETGGSVLVVSQFTLLGDTRKGRRPSFSRAAPPDTARELYGLVARELRAQGVPVREGRFQAMMDITLVNSGPVTVMVDSSGKKTQDTRRP